MWVPSGEYPSNRFQNITPYCPIQPIQPFFLKPYIGGLCWYISRVLGTQGSRWIRILCLDVSGPGSAGIKGDQISGLADPN